MLYPAVKKKITTETTARIELDEHALHEMLVLAGVMIPPGASVRIYFRVPGGGDYFIDISDREPICVEWTKKEVVDG